MWRLASVQRNATMDDKLFICLNFNNTLNANISVCPQDYNSTSSTSIISNNTEETQKFLFLFITIAVCNFFFCNFDDSINKCCKITETLASHRLWATMFSFSKIPLLSMLSNTRDEASNIGRLQASDMWKLNYRMNQKGAFELDCSYLLKHLNQFAQLLYTSMQFYLKHIH